MDDIYMFRWEELDRMDHDGVVRAYLALKERFLEQLSIDAEKHGRTHKLGCRKAVWEVDRNLRFPVRG